VRTSLRNHSNHAICVKAVVGCLKLVGGRGAAFPRRKVWTEECDRELSCIRCLWLFIFCCQRCFSFEQLLIVQTSSLAAVAVPWQVELGRGIYYLLSVLLCARLFELSYSRSSSFGHGAARVSAPLVLAIAGMFFFIHVLMLCAQDSSSLVILGRALWTRCCTCISAVGFLQ